MRPETYSKALARHRKAAGVQWIHDTRHTAAKMLLDSGFRGGG